MTKRLTQPVLDGHYEAKDLMSAWIGVFPSRDVFEAYFAEVWLPDTELWRCQFWTELGISWHDHDFQEAHFEDAVVATETLLGRELSWIDSYRATLLEACRERGIVRANAVVLIFEYEYPTGIAFKSDYLTYVGSMRYSTAGRPMRR